MTLAGIIAILELAAKYGIPFVQSAITALGKNYITDEDIEALKITKEPEEF
jgi:hypothetical protein